MRKPRFPLAEAGPVCPTQSGDFCPASSGGEGQKQESRGKGCHSTEWPAGGKRDLGRLCLTNLGLPSLEQSGSTSSNFASWAPHMSHPSPGPGRRGPIPPGGAFLLSYLKHHAVLGSVLRTSPRCSPAFTTASVRQALLLPHCSEEVTV